MKKGLLNRIKSIDKRRFAYSLFLALVLAAPTFIAYRFLSNSLLSGSFGTQIFPSHPRITGYALSVLAFFLIFIGSYVLFGKMPTWLNRLDNVRVPRIIPMTFTKRGIFSAFIILAIAWMPYFVAMFPGATTGYDTLNQLLQFLTPPPSIVGFTGNVVDADFINDNPILDTIVFGSFVWLGKALGSDMLGMFLYCILQALATALLFAGLACYGEKLNLPPALRLASLLAMAFCPLLPNAAYTMQKDSIFALFFLAYFFLYLEAFRTRGQALKSGCFICFFIISACLCCLSKTTGSYAVLASGLIMVIALKGSRIRSAVAMLMPYVLCSMLIPMFVFPAIGVWQDPNPSPLPGGSHVLLQQSITALKKHPEAYSSEDLEILDRVLDVEKAKKKFKEGETDGVSRCTRGSVSKEDVSAYLELWARIGLKQPGDYVASVAHCCGTHLVPTTTYSGLVAVSQTGIDTVEKQAARGGHDFNLEIENPAILQDFASDAQVFFREKLGTVPGFSLLMTCGLYGGWIPVACLVVAFFFRKRDSVALAPVIVTMLLLLVLPVAFTRYLVPSIYLVFPSILWAIHTARNDT